MVEEVGKERQAKLFWDKGWWMRQWRRLPPRLRITMNSNWFRLWAALWRGADHPAAYFVLFLSPPAGDYTGIEISTWHERSGLGFRSRRGRDRGWAVSTASAKRSVTGGSDGPPHCKNTRAAAVCNIDPDQLARLALLPLSDGCWGSDGAGKTKILKSNDVDKQKASNSVGHRRTICQGMLRRKTELTKISLSDSSLVQTHAIDIVLNASLVLMVEVWDDLMLVLSQMITCHPKSIPKPQERRCSTILPPPWCRHHWHCLACLPPPLGKSTPCGPYLSFKTLH